MRYLEDSAIGHMRTRGDRVWARIKRCAAVSDSAILMWDVGGAHTSPTVRDPMCNLWHPVC